MVRWTSPLRRSPELRRRLALVLAAAEDAIVQANVEEAVLLLRATESQLAFEEALEIYFRITDVPTRIQNAVTIQALSRLGVGPAVEELLEDVPDDGSHGVKALARRLRGRKREALRQEVEEASTRARQRVRASYLEGATNTVESLRDVVPATEAVQYYIDALQLGEGWAELVRNDVVGREWVEPGVVEDAQIQMESPDVDT